MIILESQRLRIRESRVSDASFLIQLLNSPGWLQYIGDLNVRTQPEAVAYLENGPLKSYKENGYGLWVVELLASSIPIGLCGMLNRSELDTPDLGYALLPAYHGQGYAREAASAVLRYAHDVLQIHVISAIVQPDNQRSIALLKKQGFSLEKLFSFPGKAEILQLYKCPIALEK